MHTHFLLGALTPNTCMAYAPNVHASHLKTYNPHHTPHQCHTHYANTIQCLHTQTSTITPCPHYYTPTTTTIYKITLMHLHQHQHNHPNNCHKTHVCACVCMRVHCIRTYLLGYPRSWSHHACFSAISFVFCEVVHHWPCFRALCYHQVGVLRLAYRVMLCGYFCVFCIYTVEKPD